MQKIARTSSSPALVAQKRWGQLDLDVLVHFHRIAGVKVVSKAVFVTLLVADDVDLVAVEGAVDGRHPDLAQAKAVRVAVFDCVLDVDAVVVSVVVFPDDGHEFDKFADLVVPVDKAVQFHGVTLPDVDAENVSHKAR